MGASETVILVIFLASATHAANITTKPTSDAFEVGKVAKITCGVSGGFEDDEELIFQKLNSNTTIATNFTVTDNNTAKYEVLGFYTLLINDVTWEDAGSYACQLTPLQRFSALKQQIFTLLVFDPPPTITMYWPGERDYVIPPATVNVTCVVGRAKPPPVIQWFRNNVKIEREMTMQSVERTPADAQGYINMTTSVLLVNVTKSEEGVKYKCGVEMAGKEEVLTKELPVTFDNDASSSQLSLSLLWVSLSITTFRLFFKR